MRNATEWGKRNMQGHGWPLNLQLFAEAGSADAGNTTATTGAGGDAGKNPTGSGATYTQEDFDKRLQSETDKRVTEALNTQRAKLEQEFAEKQKEAERLAKMSAEQRDAEIQKQAREKLDAERAEFERERLTFEVGKQLAKEGLDPNFAEFLTGANADESAANIKAFKSAFKKAVEAGVTEKLGSKPPAAGTVSAEDEADLSKMTYSEQIKWLNEHPDYKGN